MNKLLILVVLAVAQGREDPTVSNVLHRTVGALFDEKAGSSSSSTTIKVVNAGLARTGTSSFVTAMNELGLKSYHMKDGVQDTEGHMELWAEHAALAYTSNEISRDWRSNKDMAASRQHVFDCLERDGFNATADMPMNLYYKELAERYLDAVFVLTEHHSGDPNRWASSVLQTIGQNAKIFSQRPWNWIPVLRGFLRMEEWAWFGLGISRNPNTLEFDSEDLVQLYVEWNREVEGYFHEQNRTLLKFKATDGWKPLCDFLSHGLKDSAIDSKCAEIVASGSPFPTANTDLRQVFKVMNLITRFFSMPLVVLAFLFFAFLVLVYKACCCCHRYACGTSDQHKQL